MTSGRQVFSEMPVRRAVAAQCVPAVISQLVMLIYNWADSYFVGQLNDPRMLAGTAIATPIILLLGAIGNLAGVGGGTLISAALGRGDNEGAKRVASTTFGLGISCAVLFASCYAVWGDCLLRLAGATSLTIEPSHDYTVWVITLGSLVTIPNIVLVNMIRAEGMARHASVGISVGALFNVALDPLLILPGMGNMGIVGAGIATFASNVLTACYFIMLIRRKRQQTVVGIYPLRLRDALATIREIAHVGMPSSLQYLLTVLAVGAQAHFVAQYSAEAMAALGVVKRLDYLPLYFSIGISQGMLPLLAYNHAAGNHQRRREVFRFGTSISVLFAVVCFIVYEFFANEIAGIFVDEPNTRQYIAEFLRCMVVAMPFMAFCYPMITQFQSMKLLKAALVCSILRKGVVDIPLLIIYDRLWPLYGCMWVQPTVDFLAFFLAIQFYRSQSTTKSRVCC